jgi:hypothetical protein
MRAQVFRLGWYDDITAPVNSRWPIVRGTAATCRQSK